MGGFLGKMLKRKLGHIILLKEDCLLNKVRKSVCNESGRSMVELLGVLAIMAVLSIGGIYGFSHALSKYRANEALQVVEWARMEIETAARINSQARLKLDFPKNSKVSLADSGSYKNAGIRVDFGDDVGTCKQFALMYKDNPDLAVIVSCEEEEE